MGLSERGHTHPGLHSEILSRREGTKQRGRESMWWRGLTGLVASKLKLPLEPKRIIGAYIVNAFPLFLWDTFLFLVF